MAEAAKPETVKVSVTMEDSRIVEFSGDIKAKKAVLFLDAQGALTEETNGMPVGVRWDFRNGHTRTILLSEIAHIAAYYTCHGVSQKHGDEYSGEKDVDDMVLAFDALADRMKAPDATWTEKREGGFTGMSVLAKALSEHFKKSMDEVKATLKTVSPAEKAALRQSPGIREIVARLEAEKLEKSKIDVASTLAKFGAGAAA
jgi:hypothetical protein